MTILYKPLLNDHCCTFIENVALKKNKQANSLNEQQLFKHDSVPLDSKVRSLE